MDEFGPLVKRWNKYVDAEQELIKALVDAHEKGASWRKIGAVLDLSHNTLRRWVIKGRVGR